MLSNGGEVFSGDFSISFLASFVPCVWCSYKYKKSW